jgi:protein-S-isoprenylcysteine O-methyltransferase Ste14
LRVNADRSTILVDVCVSGQSSSMTEEVISMKPEHATYALWAAWLVSWTVAKFWSNRTEKRDAIVAELLFRVLFYTGLVLLLAFPPSRRSYTQTQLWQFGDAMNWILVALTGAGLLFTWWARIHLGPLWSDWVVKKAGHHLVDTGPYRLVRHPIYSGLIFTASMTALQKGTSFALLGVAVIMLAFYDKARREERFLRAQLGADAANAYDNYALKTPMLVPFVRKQQARR